MAYPGFSQLLGARLLNQRKGWAINIICVFVTTGNNWLFLLLSPDRFSIDGRKFHSGNLSGLPGAFQIVPIFTEESWL